MRITRFTRSKLLSVCIAILFSLSMIVSPAMAATIDNTDLPSISRLGGIDRYDTAAKISQAGWTKSDFAVLSAGTNQNLVDALTAGPLAKLKNAPILLTPGDALNDYAEKELVRLGTKTVYVTSGSAVIKSAVLNKLISMGIEVKALGGKDRFETALNIAKEFPAVSELVMVTAWSNADALSVSSLAAALEMPILLTDAAKLPASIASFIDGNKAKINKTYVIGGTGVVSDTVKAALPNAVRVGGTDRFATNLEVLKTFANSLKPGKIFIANGQNDHLVDSLAGAPYAAQTVSPLVLTDASISLTTKEYVKKYMLPNKLVALGGENIVKPASLADLTSAIVYSQDYSTQGSDNADSPLAVKDSLRVTGKSIALKNITAEYSVYLKGDNVTLDNVTVKGSLFIDPGINGTANLTKVKADKIVVLSGGKDSIHISQSESGELVVTTSDAEGEASTVRVEVTGSTFTNGTAVHTYAVIDARTGADLGTITVSSQPGETPVVEFRGNIQDPVVVEGQATLVAAQGAVIPKVIVASSSEQTVTLQGTFQDVQVNTHTQVTLGNNTTVSSMVSAAKANITIPPTSKINEFDGGNSGTTVSGGGDVNGDPTTNTPTVPKEDDGGSPGSPGPGGTTPQISVTSVKAESSAGNIDDPDVSGNTYTFDLSGVDDSIKLKALIISANHSSPNLVITSIRARGVDWMEAGKTITAPVSSTGKVTVRDIFGNLDSGAPGISMENLRLLFGSGSVEIKGKLTKSGYRDSAQMTVNIILGSADSDPTTISNQWMTVEKVSPKYVEVTIKDGKEDVTIGQMTGGSFNFVQVVAALALDDVDYGGASEAEDLKEAISGAHPTLNFNNITLGMLTGNNPAGKSVEFGNGYEVKFLRESW